MQLELNRQSYKTRMVPNLHVWESKGVGNQKQFWFFNGKSEMPVVTNSNMTYFALLYFITNYSNPDKKF